MRIIKTKQALHFGLSTILISNKFFVCSNDDTGILGFYLKLSYGKIKKAIHMEQQNI